MSNTTHQNIQQQDAMAVANSSETQNNKTTMNVNAPQFSTKTKDFIPMSSGMGQSFNGANTFNASAGNFTPFGAQQQPMATQYNFNYDAQSFQPVGGFQGQNAMQPPPAAGGPLLGNTTSPPMVQTGGMNNLYPSQQNNQWQNPMYQQPATSTFTPSNVNSTAFQPNYQGGRYNPPVPTQGGYMPQPNYGGGFQYNQGGYNPTNNNQQNPNNSYNNADGGSSFGGGAPRPPIAMYNQPQPHQPGVQTGGHHKKPYKGGNQNYGQGAPQYKPKSNQQQQNSGAYNKKNSYSGFEAPNDFNPNMGQYKQRNIELLKPQPQSQPIIQQPVVVAQAPSIVQPWMQQAAKTAIPSNGSTFIPSWSQVIKKTGMPSLPKMLPKLPKLPKIDKLKDYLEKNHDVKSEAEVEKFRKLIQFLKDHKEGKEVKVEELDTGKDDKEDKKKDEEDAKVSDEEYEKVGIRFEDEMRDRRKGSINLKLFFKVADLSLCSYNRKTELEDHCMSLEIVKREVYGEIDAKYGRNNAGKKPWVVQKRNPNDQGGTRHQSNTPWKREDNEEKKKLKDQAAQFKKKLGQDRSVNQKIALILNIISPENAVKKMKELRQFLFPDYKTKDETFEEEIEYNEEEHKLTDENLDATTLEHIVKNLFKKAQEEKLFCIFYGQMCEELIHLELSLRGMEQSRANLKHSKFRKNLFEVCKDCFEKFFDADEKEKQTKDPESAIRFKLKLFGNIEFVGELYRRKILPEATLVNVFESLLGMNDTNDQPNDLVIEGAVNLMNKVGQTFEQNVKNAGDKKKEDKKKSFTKILGRLDELASSDDEKVISNRVKLLIKNMFSNKDSGWLKTQDLNKGPKTKSQVQKEVEDKFLKEQQARNEGGGYRGDRGDRDRGDRRGYNDYNDGKRNNDRGHRKGGDGGKQKYQAKGGGDHSYGDGKREGKYNDGAGRDDGGKHGGGKRGGYEKVEYEEIDEQEMSSALKKNFEQYCIDFNTALEAAEEEAEEQQSSPTEAAEKKRPNYELYQNLKNVNGKYGDQVVASLLSSVFDDDTKKVEQHLARYFEFLISDKVLKPKDINMGLSRFGDLISELVLDCPQIHKYLMDCLIRPLQKKNIVQFKFISWKVEDTKKEAAEDEDDYVFGTNPFFKLLALMLMDIKNSQLQKRSWSEVVTHFEKDLKWRTIVDEKHKNIEDEAELWAEIKAEVGDVAASVILPLLQNNIQQLQEALKKAK